MEILLAEQTTADEKTVRTVPMRTQRSHRKPDDYESMAWWKAGRRRTREKRELSLTPASARR
jgi:hypothetical protein